MSAANLFSVMTLPAHLLERIPAELRKSGMLRLSNHSLALTTGAALTAGAAFELPSTAGFSSTAGLPSTAGNETGGHWKAQLLEGKFQRGAVVELSCDGGVALGTSIALRACQFAQQEALSLRGEKAWCAFVDPSASLYAPGVQAAGVDLSRLLVVRPDEESLSRVALRLVESKVFPVVVIDTMGVPGASVDISLAAWVRVVRRLSLSLEGGENSVVLLTDKNARRPLPLPVAQRFEVVRRSASELDVSLAKSTRGAWGAPAKVRWSREAVAQVCHAS